MLMILRENCIFLHTILLRILSKRLTDVCKGYSALQGLLVRLNHWDIEHSRGFYAFVDEGLSLLS